MDNYPGSVSWACCPHLTTVLGQLASESKSLELQVAHMPTGTITATIIILFFKLVLNCLNEGILKVISNIINKLNCVD